MPSKKYIKYLKLTISSVITAYMLFFCELALAQPNNDICSATNIPNLNGPCATTKLTGQTNIGSTGDYYGGCVPVGASSVWYTFTLTGANNQIDVTFTVPGSLGAPSLGQGGNVFTYLMTGSCSAPTGIATQCNLATATFHFDHLTPLGTYYLEVATTSFTTGNFNICVRQSVMPIGNQTGPEQDCVGAIPLCNSAYSYAGSYLNHGSIQDVSTSSCLLSGETNSVWYVFTAQTAGTFGFTIVTTKDYDFALYDISPVSMGGIGGCANIPSSIPIRCNFSATYGNTGMTIPGSTETPTLLVPAGGLPTMNGISNLTAGNTYALIVDNWTGDNTGFTINFLGTAFIVDNTKPTMTSIVPSCTNNTILLTMSEPIQCLSVQQNDFQLILLPATDVSSHITQILGYNCPTTNGALTNQIQITTDGTLATGSYQLVINPNPSLADKCGNIILAGSTINFNYLANITLTPTPASICVGSTVSLDANGADGGFVTYTLDPGGATNNTNGVFGGLAPTITTNYNVTTSSFGGCTRTATTTVIVEGNIITTIFPGTTTVCSFPVTLTASTTINGVPCPSCTYTWSSGATVINATQATIAVAGTYSVTATSPSGCNNGNSPSSTITSASAGTGGSSCDVIYVSPAGGGDGLTKGNPTTLATAIFNAKCTYTVIKMQVGIYILTDYQAVHSYATIEGGYDINFLTKTSNMTGGNNSTTIRRTNAGANGTDCSAFVVDVSAAAFRIQDIRIELPGSTNVPAHAAGSSRTNYGIKLGTGCTNYNIVRCYIDAGVGSAP